MTATEPRRRGISIFRAADAVDLQETDFMSSPEMSGAAREGLKEFVNAGAGAGAQVRVLVRQPSDDGGFSLVHVWFKANYPLPRHSHDADCMYYVISGSAVMGAQILGPGDGFFVPADAPYQYTAGPDGVEVLEIRRGVDRFDMQIPDHSPERWLAMAEATRANRDDWQRVPASPTYVANAGVSNTDSR
jgi:mannose-6-phosphate isomerase-like protein (cupin superfamily)